MQGTSVTTWSVITGNPRAIAPAPQATINSLSGPNALTNAGTLSAVYVNNAFKSPGLTAPNIKAALIATETTWILKLHHILKR